MSQKTVNPENLRNHDIAADHSKVKNNGYIISKNYDLIFFIHAPLVGIFVAILLLGTGLGEIEVQLYDNDYKYDVLGLFLGTVIISHLFIVFFRSHGNPDIFKLHPVRFIIAPIALILAMVYSYPLYIFVAVLAVWWDVYHSGQQTFGLGRIYDMRAGNKPHIGRRLDYFFNILIYLGPILAGASLVEHVEFFNTFGEIGARSLSDDLPTFIFHQSNTLKWLVFSIGIPFLAFYLYSYWRLYQQGYAVSIQKIILYTNTAIVSMFCWGFNTFGEAFLVMNFFHAWQYFAIIWGFENKNIERVFGVSKLKAGKWLGLFMFVGVALTFGFWATIYQGDNDFIYSAILTVSIMHFWYDGFIWSVKKKQV
ncbi:MAG: hypothetical protein GC137_10280 [Alphaproteobacteria bacterium]|nr:hypothetical protein [Alphaproteobacteria bacterium]